MADLRNDPSLQKVPEKFKVIMTEYAENIKQHGSFTGFVYGSQAEQYIRSWNSADQAQLKAALDEYAAKHNGVLEGFTDLRTGKPLVDPKTGKAPTPDAFLQQLGELSLAHMATVVKTPTLNMGDKKITAIGQPATEEQQKKDDEKKGWFARNWKWLTAVVAGLGAIGGLIAYLVHRNRKKNDKPIDKDPGDKPVIPTPGGDKDPDNPGKDPTPSNPGLEGPGSSDEKHDQAEPGMDGNGGNSGDSGNTPSTGSGTLPGAGQDITGGDTPSAGSGSENPGHTSGDTPSTDTPGTGGGLGNPVEDTPTQGSVVRPPIHGYY